MSPEYAQIASSRKLSTTALSVILRPYVLPGSTDLIRTNALRSLPEPRAPSVAVPGDEPDLRPGPAHRRREPTPSAGTKPWTP